MAHSIHFIETISLSPYQMLHNTWATSAQQLLCGLQLHRFQEQTLYLPTTTIIYFDNFSYCFQSLILLLTTTGDTCWHQLSYLPSCGIKWQSTNK